MLGLLSGEHLLLFSIHDVIVLNAGGYSGAIDRLNTNSFCFTTNLFFCSFVLSYLFRLMGIKTLCSTEKSSGFAQSAVYKCIL